MQRSITLPNDIATIPQLSEFVETVCEEMGLDMAIMMNLNLAIEEAVVNVMSYAYPDGKGDVTVDIKVDSEKVKVTLTDSGIPFDPIHVANEDMKSGLKLVQAYMSDASYSYSLGQNIVIMKWRQ